MKYQVLFSLKTMKKYSKISSAAVVIGAIRVKKYRKVLSTVTFLVVTQLNSPCFGIKYKLSCFFDIPF